MNKTNIVGWAASFVLMAGCASHRNLNSNAIMITEPPPRDQITKTALQEFPRATATNEAGGGPSGFMWFQQQADSTSAKMCYSYSGKNEHFECSGTDFEVTGPKQMAYKVHISHDTIATGGPSIRYYGLVDQRASGENPRRWRLNKISMSPSELQTVDDLKKAIAVGNWDDITQLMEPKLKNADTTYEGGCGTIATIRKMTKREKRQFAHKWNSQ